MSNLLQAYDQVPNELLNSLISSPMQPHLKNMNAPKVNPRVVQNQMVAYGKIKRSSMKSMNDNKSGS